MNSWNMLLIGLGIFVLLVLLQAIVRAAHPVQRAVGGLAIGLCALVVVNLTGVFTGVSIPLSPLAIGVSGVAGIPGVTLLLLLNLILV